MKIQTNKPSRRKIVSSIIILMVALGAVFWYLAYKNLQPSKPYNDKNQQVKDAANNSDTANPQTKQTLANPSVDTNTTTDKVPVSSTTSISITQLYQQNHQIAYAGNVTNPGPNGSCSAVFTNSISKPVTNVTPATNGQCPLTTISDEQFTSLGSWTLTLRYFNNNTQAVDKKTIEIR